MRIEFDMGWFEITSQNEMRRLMDKND